MRDQMTGCVTREVNQSITGPFPRSRLHEWRDDFRPGMIEFSFYMCVGTRDQSRPTRVEFISPMPSQTLFTHGTFILGRHLTWHFFATFHPRMTFHPSA